MEGKKSLCQWKMVIVLRLLAPVEQQEGYLCAWLLHTAGWGEIQMFIILSEGYLPCLSKDVSRHLHLDEEWFILCGFKCYILFLLSRNVI